MGDWLRCRPRPLPRRVSPVQDETVFSFLHRLAQANHIRSDELAAYHVIRHRRPWARARSRDVSLHALSMISGHTPFCLAHALPEIRPQLADQSALRVIGRTTVNGPNRTWPACRCCMAAKGITTTVTVWTRRDQNVCLRHQLWIGQGVDRPEDQVDVADLPEIGRAQSRHRNLIRRHGPGRVRYFHPDAEEIIKWSTEFPSDTRRWNRRRHFFAREKAERLPWSYDFAACYPEVVALLSVLASPHWRRNAVSDNPADRQRFYRQTAANGITNSAPDRNTPLNKWIDRHRQDRTPDDPHAEQALRQWIVMASGVEADEPEHPLPGSTQVVSDRMAENTRSTELGHVPPNAHLAQVGWHWRLMASASQLELPQLGAV